MSTSLYDILLAYSSVENANWLVIPVIQITLNDVFVFSVSRFSSLLDILT
jgi:hypothetical protein